MLLRRRLVSSVCAAAALWPALLWLSPAVLSRLAPSFRDQGDFFYPLKLYTADRLRAGESPLWNPLSGTGEPWLANGQSGVFYPPSLLFLIWLRRRDLFYRGAATIVVTSYLGCVGFALWPAAPPWR